MYSSKKLDFCVTINLESYNEQDINNLIQIAFNLGGMTHQIWDWQLSFYFGREDQWKQFYEITKMMHQIERE